MEQEIKFKNVVVGRKKVDVTTGSKATYNKFIEANPKEKKTLTYPEYKDIIKSLNNYYLDHMLETGNKVVFPYGMGKMAVTKYKRRKIVRTSPTGEKYFALQVNWHETKKQQKIVYYLNDHSDGNIYSYKWFKRDSRIQDMEIWLLKMTKNAKRRLIDRLMQEGSHYKELYREIEGRKRMVLDTILNNK